MNKKTYFMLTPQTRKHVENKSLVKSRLCVNTMSLTFLFFVCSDEPVDGAWSEWQTGTCTLTCGSGSQDKTRTCSNPAPANGGAYCPEESTRRILCNEDLCPGKGTYTYFSFDLCNCLQKSQYC